MIAVQPPPDVETILTDAIRVALEGVDRIDRARDEVDVLFASLSPSDQDKLRESYLKSMQRGADVLLDVRQNLLEITQQQLGEQAVELVLQAANFESN